MKVKKLIASFIVLVLFLIATSHAAELPKGDRSTKPNVLFIAVDDLRPELGCYGKSYIKSPNIDRLAERGMLFTNAYVNYPVCGPSRASLLSGIYPSSKRFIKWNCSQDEEVPGIVSLPMYFRNNNYQTVSLGKVYNNFEDGKGSWDKNWRAPITTTLWDYQSKEGIRIFEQQNKDRYKNASFQNYNNLPKRGLPYEKPDIPDIAYHDGQIANRAIEELQGFQNSGQPFFLAVGFHKPHLPFNAPEKYWDLYEEKDIKIPSNNYFPKSAPEAAMFNWSELRAYYGIPERGPVSDTMAYNLIHGYYACVSYVDAQIGKVLNALESLGLASNTIIVLWGDNGWFLDEHGFWSKHGNFERAVHIPLIVKVPWDNSGQKVEALIESVDIYPTLCELTGLSLPFHLQGKSFTPLIDNPSQPWKEAIFYRMGKGETILTHNFAYTEWINYKTEKPYARMLYDHLSDPEENINIAELSGNKKIVEELHEKLLKHIKERDKVIIP
jgi:arylsulfatase A-like enzyme